MSPEKRTDTPPEEIIDRVEQLTRQARAATDDAERQAYLDERTRLLAVFEYQARVREDETGDVLVCHPSEWVHDGTIRPSRVETIERGIERPLSGPGEESWNAVDKHNQTLIERVRDTDGDVHAENVSALADFAGNHYKKPIEELTAEELTLFCEEYYPRNVWPSKEAKSVVETSIRRVFDVSDDGSLPRGFDE